MKTGLTPVQQNRLKRDCWAAWESGSAKSLLGITEGERQCTWLTFPLILASFRFTVFTSYNRHAVPLDARCCPLLTRTSPSYSQSLHLFLVFSSLSYYIFHICVLFSPHVFSFPHARSSSDITIIQSHCCSLLSHTLAAIFFLLIVMSPTHIQYTLSCWLVPWPWLYRNNYWVSLMLIMCFAAFLQLYLHIVWQEDEHFLSIHLDHPIIKVPSSLLLRHLKLLCFD